MARIIHRAQLHLSGLAWTFR